MSHYRFRLLSLPYIPLDQIICEFDNFTFLNFSLCSRQTNKAAKSVDVYMKPVAFHVNLDFDLNDVCVQAKFINNEHLKIKASKDGTSSSNFLKEGVTSEDTLNNSITAHALCVDPIETILTIADYLLDLFNIQPAITVHEGDIDFTEQHLKLITDWLPSSVRYFAVCYFENFEPVKRMLEKINYAERLTLMCNDRFDNNYLMSQLERIQYENLHIDHADRLTLQNILSLKNLRVLSVGTSMTDVGMNVLLKAWKQGWNNNLEYLGLHMPLDRNNRWEEGVIMDGLDATVLNADNVKMYQDFHYYSESYTFYWRGGWEIKRELDGAVATVTLINGYLGVHFAR